MDLPFGPQERSSCVFLKTFRDVQIKGQGHSLKTRHPQLLNPVRDEAEPRSLDLVVGVLSLPPAGWISPNTACGGWGGSCCGLLFHFCLPENWVECRVEALGELLGWRVVSPCQEEPLTHRRLFSCQKGEVVISTSPRGKTKGNWFIRASSVF